jgi:acetolactate synthase-1/2/3 large subunit
MILHCIPLAIGAKLGAPERTVCCFVGDGGLQMTLQELGTIMQEKLNVKIILLNNDFLGMVRQWQELFWHERYSFTTMENPDFVAIAKAYRLGARAVSGREELDDAIREMLDYDGGYLLVAHVEKSGMVYPMVPAGKSLNEMIVE